jgi:hypothetical protein
VRHEQDLVPHATCIIPALEPVIRVPKDPKVLADRDLERHDNLTACPIWHT